MTIEQHITAIQTRLQTVEYNGNPLAVSKYFVTTANIYPYFYITDGEIRANTEGKQYELGPNGTYKRTYQYEISVVFAVDLENFGNTQDEIRAITGLLLDKLQGADMLAPTPQEISDGIQIWTDFNLISVSRPINGVEVELTDNNIIKIFIVEVEELVEIPD
jgi:hypothetical protein